jgi:hypothetical protein
MTNWYKKATIIEATEGFDDRSDDSYNARGSKWTSLDSSFITDVAYNENLEMFELKMKSGHEYSYSGIPKGVYDDFMASDSKGKFFNSVIKPVYRLIRED